MRISDYLIKIENICKRPKTNEEDGSVEMIERKYRQPGLAEESYTSHHVAAAASELSPAYISSTLSSPAGAGAMDISLPQCGIDDETLHNVLEALSEECGPVSWPDVPKGASSQDIPMTFFHQHIGDGDYLSRIICLNLKGNSLTDLSCEVRCIVYTSLYPLLTTRCGLIFSTLFLSFCLLFFSLFHSSVSLLIISRTHMLTLSFSLLSTYIRTHTQSNTHIHFLSCLRANTYTHTHTHTLTYHAPYKLKDPQFTCRTLCVLTYG